jgi:hypothetical protein
MRLDPSLITVSAGGESIPSVMGRAEEAEFPTYKAGAFGVAGCSLSVTGDLPHYLSTVMNTGFKSTESLECTAWEEQPTLFITRYEYANLYHTCTDWYNTWATLGWADLLEARADTQAAGGRTQITRPRAHGIVWLDGHAQGSIDDVWTSVFTTKVRRVAQVPQGTCFRRALFIPAGYSAPIYDWPDQCGAQTPVREFAEFVLHQYGLSEQPQQKQATFIFREAYLAHPRNPGRDASRHVHNRAEIEAVLARHNSISLNPINVSFVDQLRAVHSSRVLLGVHGAGLTHVLFMPAGSQLVELQPPTHPLGHFEKLSRWAGVSYTNHPPVSLDAVGPEDYNISPAAFENYLATLLH